MKKIFFELDSFEDNYKQTHIATISLINYEEDDDRHLFLMNKDIDVISGWYENFSILGGEPTYKIRYGTFAVMFEKLKLIQLEEGRRKDDILTESFTLENFTELLNIFGDDMNSIVQKISNFISENGNEKHRELTLYNLDSVFQQKAMLDLTFYGYRNVNSNIYNVLVKSEIETLIQFQKETNPDIVNIINNDEHLPKLEDENLILDVEHRVRYSKKMHHFINNFVNGKLVYSTQEESESEENSNGGVEEYNSKEL